MEHIYNSVDSAMNWLFSSKTRATDDELEPSVRSAVAASELSTELSSSAAEVAEIDSDIQTAKADLVKAEEKERFVGLRIYKYQNDLHERRRILDEHVPGLQAADETEDLLDEENPDDGTNERDEARAAATHARLLDKWEQDSRALEKVVKSHQTILMHCEEIRRKLKDLESKRHTLDNMRREYGGYYEQEATKGRAADVEDQGHA
ncbi:hypothetical protein MPSEU_001099900 [Mayamaea pseudoterrestris]|nr:hypothetical protein MPSEU_001099900 [Mayamaea pseudoterrestris]